MSAYRSRGHEFKFQLGPITFVEIGYEIISSLPLIQEGQLSVTGGSNEYPQSVLLSRNKKNDVYPCKPQVYYIKVEFKGVKII